MEANRQLRDTARDLKDAGSLIGLSPFQRSLRENANTSRRERETLTMGGASAGTAPLTRDQTLDLIMKPEALPMRKKLAMVKGLAHSCRKRMQA